MSAVVTDLVTAIDMLRCIEYTLGVGTRRRESPDKGNVRP